MKLLTPVPSPRNAKRAVFCYGVAVLSIILAWLLRWALDPYLGDIQPFATFYIAITFVAWWAGTGPAVLALILGYFTAHWFFLPPRHALALEDFADVVQHLAYYFVTGTTVFLIHSMRKAQHDEQARAQAEQSRLENEVRQRRRIEEQLRFQLQLVRSIADAAAVCIFGTDEKGRITFMNPEAERVFGFTLSELQGQSMHDAIHHHYPGGEPFPQSECPINKVYESGVTTRSYEELFFRKDGSTVPVVCSNSALWNEGKVVGAVLVAQDITERKRAEKALREAKLQLAQANADLEKKVADRTAKLQEVIDELEHFSYSITHDMRAPLRAMRSFASLLEEGLCAVCRRSSNLDSLRRIQEAARRMDNLIQDSLDYSKAVGQPLPLEPVDLAKLLPTLVETYANLREHSSSIYLAPDLPCVLGNEAALTQCFSNLLGNAVKFVSPGVVPQVRVWAEDSSERLPAQTQPSDGRAPRLMQPDAPVRSPQVPRLRPRVRIWVRDNGIGIPTEALHLIFDMFQRATTQYEGTGVGLAIVRKVVKRMGGEVGVQSEPGRGSRFWVELERVGGQPQSDRSHELTRSE